MKISAFGSVSLQSVRECPMCGNPLPSSRVCANCGIQWGDPNPSAPPISG